MLETLFSIVFIEKDINGYKNLWKVGDVLFAGFQWFIAPLANSSAIKVDKKSESVHVSQIINSVCQDVKNAIMATIRL